VQDRATDRAPAAVSLDLASPAEPLASGTDRRSSPRRLDDKKFSFLADILPDMVWTACPDGSIDYVNQRWYDYTGQTPAEALEQGWEPVIHPDDRDRTLEAWAHANATGVAEAVEHRFRKHTGEYRLHVTRYAPQRDPRGIIVRWVGTSSDIHDERQREAQMAESRKRAALSDLAHHLAHDLNNPLAALMNLVYIAKSKAESDEGKQLIEHAEQQVERISNLVHGILALENTGPEHADKYPSMLDAARVRRQKKEYEAALHLASIVESAQDAIYSKKMDGTIIAWNSAAERLYGYPAAAIVGRNVSMLMPPELQAEIPDIMTKLKRGERVEQYETESVTRDGRRIRTLVSISPVRNSNGEVIGASAIARQV